MSKQQVWLITGAGRGLGIEIVKAALAKGHLVVATARNVNRAAAQLSPHANLRVVELDVTQPEQAEAAMRATVEAFGRLDVLVNNAGNFRAGYFEELSPDQIRDQIETLLFGPMNVTRAALPLMREARAGLVLTISSTAGIIGQAFCSAYAAAKFGVEGWMESLAVEVQPFGIRTMLVEPGFFRTELLSESSTDYAELSISDYAERTRQTVEEWTAMDGKQGGDPAKLAGALIQLLELEEPPVRFAAGSDAVETFEAKAKQLSDQAQAYRELSCSMSIE